VTASRLLEDSRRVSKSQRESNMVIIDTTSKSITSAGRFDVPTAGHVRHRAPTVSVALGAMALLSAQPVSWAASLIQMALLPRYLGEHGLGEYAVALTLANMAWAGLSLGLPRSLPRRIAKQPSRAALEGAAGLVLLVGVALPAYGVLCAVVPFLPLPVSDELLLRVTLASIVVLAAQNALASTLTGQERIARLAWITAAVNLFGTTAGCGVLISGGSVAAYASVVLAAQAIVVVVGWYCSGPKLSRAAFTPKLWGELLREGLPFLVWNVAARVREEGDRIILAALASTSAVGWYAAASRIIAVPLFIPGVIQTPLLPALSRSGATAVFRQTLRRSLQTVLLLTIPLTGGILALAPDIPTLLGWGSEFRNSVPLLMILSFYLPVVGTNMILESALFALHEERRWLRIGLLGAVFNPLMNILLIPAFEHWWQNGAIAASLVLVATELVMLAGALIVAPHGVLDRSMLALGFRLGVAGGCLVVVVRGIALFLPMVVPSIALVALVAATAGGTVFLGVSLRLGVVRPAELRAVTVLAMDRFHSRRARAAA
jgi:O-antigen/teichoic acid export membrane protein